MTKTTSKVLWPIVLAKEDLTYLMYSRYSLATTFFLRTYIFDQLRLPLGNVTTHVYMTIHDQVVDDIGYKN
jgi:hypothetical protein